jgi:TP901 family phage tail tape measure protein
LTNVGHATISVLPDMSKFSTGLSRGLRTAVGVGGIGAAFGIGKFINDSVRLEASFGSTMAQMKVATESSAEEMQRLNDLAIDLGKKTVFSANEASDAMLELAKNGIKPATIEAGALQSALTLAAAGGTDLTFAAKTMGNAINAFGLKGKDAGAVADALAGAANASSASIESLAQGLQQAASGADAAGFNVQETTAVLAAFANQGIAGSDAGTSLKTMLTRLIPATDKTAKAMKKYGLVFTTANGEFKSATGIAKELKHDLGGLSDVEKAATLNTIFGSDARRAATILTEEGAKGLQKYIDATSAQGSAEELAQAKMKGTAGAMERLAGAWETAKLELGKAIAPTVQDFLKFATRKLDELSPKLTEFGNWFNDKGAPGLKRFGDELRPIANDLLPAAGTALGVVRDFAKDAAPYIEDMAEAFNDMPSWAKKALVGGVIGGTLFVKFGGGSLLKGIGGVGKSLFARGSTPANPLYVLDVGAGLGKGQLGAGSKVFNALGKGGLLAAFGLATVIATKQDIDLLKGGVRGAVQGGGRGTPFGGEFKGDPQVLTWAEKFGEKLEYNRRKIFANKEAIEEFGDSVRTRIPRTITTKYTLLGVDVANDDARKLLETLLAIRSLHMDNRLDFGPSGSAPTGDPTPPSDGKGGGKASGRGVFDGATFNVQPHDYKDFMHETQRRATRASMDGLR